MLAAQGDAYEIELWPMPTLQAASPPPAVTSTSEGAVVAVAATATVTGHVGLVVTRADYTKQAAAVASRAVWPTWLRVALELNYLGETAREDRPALVSHWSALEVIVHGTQGTPSPLAKAVLGEEAAAEIRKEMQTWLEGHGLDATQAQRMTAQAMNAHLEGNLDRTVRTLGDLGAAVAVRDLKQAGEARGSVVHAEKQPSDEVVRQALEAVRTWLRASLSTLLDRYAKQRSTEGSPSLPSAPVLGSVSPGANVRSETA